MKFNTIVLSCGLLALASPAFAQTTPSAPNAPAQAQQGQRQGPFERMDTNNDGVITRDEVRIARTATFTRLDADRDGFLVATEMRSARTNMGQGDAMGAFGSRREKAGRRGADQANGGGMLARADANNDGNITRAEFDAAARNNPEGANAGDAGTRRQRLFERLDTNRDGTITRAEAEAMRAQMPQRAQAAPNPRQQGAAKIDTNNDQKVSLAEWLARPDPLFERGDANKDGRVTREEAAAVVREGRGQNGRPARPW